MNESIEYIFHHNKLICYSTEDIPNKFIQIETLLKFQKLVMLWNLNVLIMDFYILLRNLNDNLLRELGNTADFLLLR